MTKTPDPPIDPLAPIEFVVTILSGLVVALFVVTIPFTVFGSVSFMGIGDKEACATVRSGTVPYFVADGVTPSEGVRGLHRDARSWPEDLQICNRDPSVGVKAASVVSMGLDLAMLLGFLWLTRRLIQAVRRERLFAQGTAARARMLGWFLIAGSVFAALIGAVLRGIVVSTAVENVSWTRGLGDFDMPWAVVIAGLGVITFSRVLRHAIGLQDEVDATI
jgi:hypothetical protein